MENKEIPAGEQCCAPACGPETCPPSRSRKKLFGSMGAVAAVLLGGWLVWTQVLHNKTAMAEIILQDGGAITAEAIDNAMREAGFKGAEIVSQNGNIVTCQLSGLGGQCCIPGARAALMKLPGVKEVMLGMQ